MSKEIPLTQGKVALVDEADYEWLMQWKWCAIRRGTYYYAARGARLQSGKRRNLYMHRAILDVTSSDLVDHRDTNGLNNTRANIRVCTRSQNAMNQSTRNDNTSGYKGVSWLKRSAKWQAQIMAGGKLITLGYFDNVKDAAEAYNIAALAYFGDFARPNLIGDI